MHVCGRRFRVMLIAATMIIGAGGQAAIAQELQVDAKSFDMSGSSVQANRKGKKGAEAAAQQGAAKPGAQQGGGPNRQFGELEGWSPGKAPPKPKGKGDDDQSAPSGGKAPVSVSPSGNMSVGLPF